jgi:serine/threonine protein kinase
MPLNISWRCNSLLSSEIQVLEHKNGRSSPIRTRVPECKLPVLAEIFQGTLEIFAKHKALPMEIVFTFFEQLRDSLDWLHAHSICHHHLKTINILLTEIKIADFGFASWMKQKIAKASCGSPHSGNSEAVRDSPICESRTICDIVLLT